MKIPNVKDIDFSETTGCLAAHAFTHSMVATMEAVSKGKVPQEAAGSVTIAHLVAASAGPLSILAGTIAKATGDKARSMTEDEKRDTDPSEVMLNGITPDLMLFSSLLVHRGLVITGSVYDFDFGPSQIAAAMRDFKTLTGREIASQVRGDMVHAATVANEIEGDSSEELLRLLRNRGGNDTIN